MSAGRMNVEVTATTGKFAAAMKQVRQDMATTARAAGKGFSIGGMGRIGGPLGGVGESIGVLSGPMMALVAGLAGLSVAMRALSDRMEAGRENLSEMRLLGLGVEEQARLKTIGSVIRPDGTGADALSLRDKFAEVAPGFGMNIAGLDLAAQFEEMRKAAQSADALTIAEQLGGKAGEDFMRLRMTDADALRTAATSQTTGRALAGASIEEQIRQQQAASRDPNDPSMLRDALDWATRQSANLRTQDELADPIDSAALSALGQIPSMGLEAATTGLVSLMVDAFKAVFGDDSPRAGTASEQLEELRRMNHGLNRQGPGI